jgi:serine/threonine protein kinase
MSTQASEPGSQLAGRYRLVDQTSAGTGWTFWKAIDEILARFVTVLMFAADFPRTADAITAARTASRVGDTRFSQVFDVEDADGHAYVVMEWVVGESLLDMLAQGPLDAPRAVSLVSEAAQAVANAHAFGLAHLRLRPECLHWTRGSGVKITGLGIAAVLADTPATAFPAAGGTESAELTDTRDLARLLYAALTGYWPGPREPGEPGEPGGPRGAAGAAEAPDAAIAGAAPPAALGLPPAPEADGVPLTPQQLFPAVPAAIDTITCEALFQQPGGKGQALSTPAMLAEALANVTTPDLPPVLATSTTTMSLRSPAASLWATDGTPGPGGLPSPYPEIAPTRPASRAAARAASRAASRRPAERSPAPVILSAVIVLIVAAAGVAGWALSHRGAGRAAAGLSPTNQSSSPAPSAAASVVLRPVGANSFDVYPDGGNEDANGAKYAIDNNSSTFWHTEYYDTYPDFGNLKKGTGLILDMGEQVRLSQVVVQFGTSCCTHVEIEIGNSNDPVPATLSTFTPVASSTTASGVTDFNVTSKDTGRYVLIWITRLPPLAGSNNQYEAQIYNVVIHGSAVSQSG